MDFALETIRDFISARQSAYVSRFKVLSTSVLSSLDDEAASGVIASLCACVNNHFHFSDMVRRPFVSTDALHIVAFLKYNRNYYL